MLLAALAAGMPVAAQRDAAGEPEVHDAIVTAVLARVGQDVEVVVEGLEVKAAARPAGRLVATPEPGARLGRPARFSLAVEQAGARHKRAVGYALATVSLTADCVRLARAVTPGTLLAEDDLLVERADPGPIALQRLPTPAEIAGSRARRRLEAGQLLLASMVTTGRLVQSGEAVTIRARAEGVEVEVGGIATQSGGAGDIIRVVNASSRRPLTARIVGPGEVEVLR